MGTIINQFADCPPDDVAAWIPRFRNQNVRRLTTSVAMVTYRRTPQMRNTFDTYLQQERRPDQIVVVEDGFEDGTCALACEQYRDRGLPIEYYLRKNRPDVAFSNAAIPRNIAIKRCTGDIILLHNSEVRFTQPTDFANIVGPVEEDSMVSSCAPCMSLNEDGTDRWWYCDPSLNNFNHFCQAYRREHITSIGGFDEAYRGYGYEDGSFNWRLERSGVRNRWARNVITQHQWHFIAVDPNNAANEAFNLDYGKQEVNDILTGRRSLVANSGREWGDIKS